MHNPTYLIVGGGMTAAATIAGIRQHDRDGSILVVSAEAHPPYKRPHLSKRLWQGGEDGEIWLGTMDAELALGRRIVSLDIPAKAATDDQGGHYGYDKVLIATGGTPRRLGGNDNDVIYFRTFEDYKALRAVAKRGASITVIGGGFVGSEIAAALVGEGVTVTMVFPEPAVGSRIFPRDLADFVTDYYRERGVEMLPDEMVSSVDGATVTLASGRRLDADAVVAGLGIAPSTDLAERAGLAVDNGIVVDEFGHVEGNGRGYVFAAGDVASFPSRGLGDRIRVEHEDHASAHGRAVGANMAGQNAPYDYLPLFYSDLFDLGYEAIGELDPRTDTVADWETPFRKGVVAYVDDSQRPRGYLLWDTWGKVGDARERIIIGEPVTAGSLLD